MRRTENRVVGGVRETNSTDIITIPNGGSGFGTTGRCLRKSALRFSVRFSWLTILRKRENFRAAFANFEIEKVAAFTDADIGRCLQDDRPTPGQIVSTINNAKRART